MDTTVRRYVGTSVQGIVKFYAGSPCHANMKKICCVTKTPCFTKNATNAAAKSWNVVILVQRNATKYASATLQLTLNCHANILCAFYVPHSTTHLIALRIAVENCYVVISVLVLVVKIAANISAKLWLTSSFPVGTKKLSHVT